MPSEIAEFKVGEVAPDFSLESNNGTVIHLSDYRERSHIVLYFMREFACMTCQHHAAELGRLYEQLKAQDTEILVIGGGTRKDAERLSNLLKLPFPVLGDPAREIYRNYGLDKVLGAFQRSGTFVIDKHGLLRYINQVTNPQASVDKAALLNEIQKLQTA